MMIQRKKWNKPQLIMLVKTKPEELIMGTCKWVSYDVIGPGNPLYTCWQPGVPCEDLVKNS